MKIAKEITIELRITQCQDFYGLDITDSDGELLFGTDLEYRSEAEAVKKTLIMLAKDNSEIESIVARMK